MMPKHQVRFGGGLVEKGRDDTSPSAYPTNLVQSGRDESVAEFRRRVPCLRSAGFFDEIEELGGDD